VIVGFVDSTRKSRPNPEPNMIYCPYQMQTPVFEVTAITSSERVRAREDMKHFPASLGTVRRQAVEVLEVVRGG
jgi:hypothetical protein